MNKITNYLSDKVIKNKFNLIKFFKIFFIDIYFNFYIILNLFPLLIYKKNKNYISNYNIYIIF